MWENRAEPLPIRFDVRESAEAYTVNAELPGVKKEDIHVEIEGNEVTISAETRRDTEQKDGDKWLRTERYFGKSARRFALPQELDSVEGGREVHRRRAGAHAAEESRRGRPQARDQLNAQALVKL